jgi:hypothetical protein
MILEKQIDRTLFIYNTESGDLNILGEDGHPRMLPHDAVYGLIWFMKMASVAQHAARIERQRLQEMQEYEQQR